ncbi:hypothetical protein ABZV77_28005 [Streptomyces sp. NPDC004732]|uniref:hypothetical protein n=1 Tax=Streptomyces sp. NPDC004732 TaxID=3154290 RepID=UPI0033A062AA
MRVHKDGVRWAAVISWTPAQRDRWAASALRCSGRRREALTALRELAADYERRLHCPDHTWTRQARTSHACALQWSLRVLRVLRGE